MAGPYTPDVLVEGQASPGMGAAVLNRLEQGVVNAANRRFQKCFVCGHSGAEPYGVYNQFGWPQKVARHLGAELINCAMSGSILGVAETSSQRGGYASILNLAIPNDPEMASTTRRTNRRVAPYTPPADLVCHQGLSNDLGLGTGTPTKAQAMARAQDTLEALINYRFRAGAYFNDDDAQVAYSTGTAWGVIANVPQISTYGSGRTQTATGQYFDFTTLSDFAGEVCFAFFVGSNLGGQVSFTDVTGGGSVALGTLDMSTIGGPAATYRITHKRINMAALGLSGARTIRCTVTGVSGSNDGTAVTGVGFDGVSVTAIDALPLVVLINHPDFPGAVAGDADLIDNACRNIVTKFKDGTYGTDGRVVLGDLRGAMNTLLIGGVPANQIPSTSPRTIFNNPDGHANEIGHAIEAQTILNAIQAAAGPVDAARNEAAVYSGPTVRKVQANGTLLADASFATGWAPGTFSVGATGIEDDITGLGWSRDVGSMVSFRGSAVKTSGAAAILEQMTSDPLPLYARPMESTILPCVALSSGNVVAFGAVMVASNGHIYHIAGVAAASTQIFITGSYQADGGLRDSAHP